MATGRSLFKAARGGAHLLGLAVVLAAWALPATAQAPDESWMTFETEHFRVTFPEGLETLARRVGDHAEEAYRDLGAQLLEPARGTIDIAVTDHVDVSNGFARILPSSRIVVFARPPVDGISLGYFDEWLELVVTHEVAHVVHLDRTVHPLGKLARTLLGRYPESWPIFTGLDSPRWTREGLATWYESRLSASGRLRGTYHEMVLRTAVLEGRHPRIDQAAGESPVWPAGDRAYAYGSRFFEHLLDKHGEERMGVFVEAVAGQWIPYRLNAAASDAFGATFSDEWDAWSASLEARYADLERELSRLGPVTTPERLTERARVALYPRVSPDGDAMAYLRSDGRSDQQLVLARPDGSDATRLARNNGLGTFGWLPDGRVLMAQLERADRYRTYSDLYVVERDGTERRLTTGARLTHAASAPDGTWVVAVQEGGGTNRLVRLDLSTGRLVPLTPADPGVHWAFPDVHPGGRWIAVSRWREGSYMDVVVLDLTGEVRLEVTRDRALDVAPRWTPDGERLVWGSDRTGIPNILSAEVEPARDSVGELRLLTNVRTGAAYPSVDPSGAWLHFSGYHADGWEIERIPFEPDGLAAAPAPDPRFDVAEPYEPPPPAAPSAQARPYSPGPTLAPTYWEPELLEEVRTPGLVHPDLTIPGRRVLGLGVGARTSGADLVGRHSYGVAARFRPEGGTFDGAVGYGYAGLGNPTLSVSASQAWRQGGVAVGYAPPDSTAVPLFILARARSVNGGVTFSDDRWRLRRALTLGAGLSLEHRELLDDALEPVRGFALSRPARRFSDLTATISLSTARGYAFQLGGSAGASGFLRLRRRNEHGVPPGERGLVGLDGSFDEVVAQTTGYVPLGGPGHAPHVLAARGRAGAASGPGAGRSHFLVGGASGGTEAVTGLGLFGGTPLSNPVRGYEVAARAGRTAWTGSLEYRFPIRMVDRGLGAWPAHADRVVGSLFVDAGNAWAPDPRRPTLVSTGAEITTQIDVLWGHRLRVRTGGAVPLVEGTGGVFYVRLGLSF